MRRKFAAAAFATITAVICSMEAPRARAATAAADLQPRLDRLEAGIAAGEDILAIKKLQRAYGYYLDKGMWEDLSVLFTDDAVANYPAGVFVGRASIRKHLYMNVGAVKVGELGLGRGRLYNHMNVQPVVHLEPGGHSAQGRWRALAMIGSYGGNAMWAEGIYEITYLKDHGVWKIHTLDYYSGFGAPYQTGWIAPETPRPAGSAGRRALPYPPDRERKMECDGFPAACIAPFHYGNPGTTASASAWTTPSSYDSGGARRSDTRTRLADLARRATLLQDEQSIENLQRIYGYYVDRAMWDQVADLFAADGTIEIGLAGVYAGKPRVRQFLDLLGPEGLSAGRLSDHIQLQTLVDVAPDGTTAYCRSRELAMTGEYQKQGAWSEGVYENTYVKDHGLWKFKSLHFYPTVSTDYDQGWAKNAQAAPGPSTALPPDRPPTESYGVYPEPYVPPYHYRNPVTGEAPHYPTVGGPDKLHAAAALMPARKATTAALRAADIEPELARSELQVERVKSYAELENLESAYGYYLDKNLWNDLADLFARNGSLELAQRGVYQGRDHVRAFLLKVFGRGQEGPVAGRLGNHLQLQPVIDVAADGQSAKIRVRLLQQMSFGPRASIGAGVYENEAVKEDGVWRFKSVHTYNTLTAGYDGGWARSASRAMPGPSVEMPPDAPPTMVFAMFPAVYDVPFHYPNPVTGRTDVPLVAASADAGVTAALATNDAGKGGMPPGIAAALREIGPKVEGPRTAVLYAPLQSTEPYQGITLVRDIAYGPDERQVLDVFSSADQPRPAVPRAVVVFIYGGGFSRGSKHTPGSPFYDNVALWAAKHGLLGVNSNYRLAPQYRWPAGIEDLSLLIAWLEGHVADYGGDPGRIFLWGHSSGAAHVADYIAHQVNAGNDAGIAGAILTSGFYELGGKVSVWKDYYGEDVSQYPARSSLPGLLKTATPLFVTYAELDPDMFQSDAQRLIEARAQSGRPVRSLRLAGHSHLSETYAVGTADESLSAPVLDFIRSGARSAGKDSR